VSRIEHDLAEARRLGGRNRAGRRSGDAAAFRSRGRVAGWVVARGAAAGAGASFARQKHPQAAGGEPAELRHEQVVAAVAVEVVGAGLDHPRHAADEPARGGARAVGRARPRSDVQVEDAAAGVVLRQKGAEVGEQIAIRGIPCEPSGRHDAAGMARLRDHPRRQARGARLPAADVAVSHVDGEQASRGLRDHLRDRGIDPPLLLRQQRLLESHRRRRLLTVGRPRDREPLGRGRGEEPHRIPLDRPRQVAAAAREIEVVALSHLLVPGVARKARRQRERVTVAAEPADRGLRRFGQRRRVVGSGRRGAVCRGPVDRRGGGWRSDPCP